MWTQMTLRPDKNLLFSWIVIPDHKWAKLCLCAININCCHSVFQVDLMHICNFVHKIFQYNRVVGYDMCRCTSVVWDVQMRVLKVANIASTPGKHAGFTQFIVLIFLHLPYWWGGASPQQTALLIWAHTFKMCAPIQPSQSALRPHWPTCYKVVYCAAQKCYQDKLRIGQEPRRAAFYFLLTLIIAIFIFKWGCVCSCDLESAGL